MEYRDYYKILGVTREATQDEIKRTYRKLARKFHPDVSKESNAADKFKEVNEAYEVLKDPQKRQAYDQIGERWQAGQEFTPPPNWERNFDFGGADYSSAGTSEFSDFFENLFGGRGFSGFGRGGYGNAGFQAGNARGEDATARIFIDLEDAYTGATRAVTLTQTQLGADGQPKQQQKTFNVKIPKGICQGQNIRLAKQGNPGYGQAQPGDLYLEVGFKPHPFFKVENKDVFLELPVAPWEAALGANIHVPTPDGKLDLKIPANTANGRKLRLKGKGIPASEPGDLYVVVTVKTPGAHTEQEKTAYQAFAKAFNFNPRADLGV